MIPDACDFPRCVALRSPGSIFCAIHQNLTTRQLGDAAIRCAACTKPIRIGQRWLMRTEGAFHATTACLNKPAELRVEFVHRARPAKRLEASC
jgi:hypothetical protein